MIRPSPVRIAAAAALFLLSLGANAQGFGSVSSEPAPAPQATPAAAAQSGPTAEPTPTIAAPPSFSSESVPTPVTTSVPGPTADGQAPQAAMAAPEAPAAAATTTVPFGSVSSATVAAAPPPRTSFESADRVVVKKSERRLYLMRANQIIAEYPIRLGLNPRGPKEREGDFRTPEGTYQLVRRNRQSNFFLSLEVSYPNDADRTRAKKMGTRPGGLIMIHGQPNVPRKSPDYYRDFDWTDGCIAVSNPDMVDIWLRTGPGTPIEIVP